MSGCDTVKDNVLTDIEIQKKSGTDYLVYIYSNGAVDEHKIYEADYESNGLRFITRGNKSNRYFLVENEQYINMKIAEEGYSFEKHIFLVDINIGKDVVLGDIFSTIMQIKRPINFSGAVFSKSVNFTRLEFALAIDFSCVKFLKKAEFYRTIFTEEVDFLSAEFFKEADFHNAHFLNNARFAGVKFLMETNFFSVKFSGWASFAGTSFLNAFFSYAEFLGNCWFNNVTCLGKMGFGMVIFRGDVVFNNISCKNKAVIDFHSATFYNKLTIYINEKQSDRKLKLDLTNVFLDTKKFNYNKGLIVALDLKTNRDTYLRLKDVALTRHDHITALGLHQREYETYYRLVKYRVLMKVVYWTTMFVSEKVKNKIMSKKMYTNTRKSVIDLFKSESELGSLSILFFERQVSYFGTSIWRALFFWVISVLSFGLLVVLIYKGSNSFGLMKGSLYDVFMNHTKFQELLTYAFHPISIILSNDFLKDHSRWSVLMFVNFIKTVILSVVTYELIKALRKFSRKL